MNGDDETRYAPEAYAPDGTLWWQLKTAPNKGKQRFGDEQKLAAYLAFGVGLGHPFTMRELRSALGEETVPNNAEHLNRRLRTLRIRDGWDIPSAKDDGSLGHDEYRVRKVGWHPGTGRPRPTNDAPSDAVRRRVFERDNSTCQVCFTRFGEPYVDRPDKVARATLGHRIPGKRLSKTATIEELRAECARCNETVRDELFDPATWPEIQPTMRSLRLGEKKELLSWLEAGRRAPTRVEQVYADIHRLSTMERELAVATLRLMVDGRDFPGI